MRKREDTCNHVSLVKKTRASEKRRDQNISKNTAMELSSAPCGSGGNSYLSSRKEREGMIKGRKRNTHSVVG
jgi:hypothetical protein